MSRYEMTPKEFCLWLSGFIHASHHFNLTPEAWETLKEALKNVNYDKETRTGSFLYDASKNYGVTNTTLGPKKEQLND